MAVIDLDYEWPPMFDHSSTWERAYQEWDRRTKADLVECLRREHVDEAIIAVIAERFDAHIQTYPSTSDIESRLHWFDRGVQFLDWAKRIVDRSARAEDRRLQ